MDEYDEFRSPVSSSSLSASTLVSGLPEQVGSEQKIHHYTLFRFSSSLFFGLLNQDRTGQKWNHVGLILYFLPIIELSFELMSDLWKGYKAN